MMEKSLYVLFLQDANAERSLTYFQADVFWQDTGFNLEHERFKCDMSDGTYSLVSHESPDGVLSDDSDMPDVSIYTGLAAVRLSSSDGTRLFFHDSDAALHQLEYISSGSWDYVGQVNPDGHLQGPSLGAAVVDGTTNMYTVQPRSDDNLEIANTTDGDTWDIGRSPGFSVRLDTSKRTSRPRQLTDANRNDTPAALEQRHNKYVNSKLHC